MRVELGATVRTSDGKDVGKVDQLILDPASNEVKAAAVRKGFFLPRDVEIPLDIMERGEGNEILLTYTSDQVDKLPDFYESNYTTMAPSGFVPPAGYPATGFFWPITYGWAVPNTSTGNTTTDREVEAVLRRQDMENAVIAEGSDVIDRDGDKVGEVRELTFDPNSGHLTHLVVRKGHLFGEDVSLPAAIISHVDDGAIYLKVRGSEIAA